MTSNTKRLVQKSIAVVVIVAILQLVGLSPMMMLFATAIIFLVWTVNHRSLRRELEHIFNFYVAADSILRDDDRRWYAFEVVEIIDEGERAFDFMADCPALHLFALGALYHRIGKHDMTVEYLGRVLEDEAYDERQNLAPSPQLRRYVSMLRRLEANPSIAPQKLAAVRNLERLRRRQASHLLQESRRLVKCNASGSQTDAAVQDAQQYVPVVSPGMTSRPPISEVLHDVYQDENSSLN